MATMINKKTCSKNLHQSVEIYNLSKKKELLTLLEIRSSGGIGQKAHGTFSLMHNMFFIYFARYYSKPYQDYMLKLQKTLNMSQM